MPALPKVQNAESSGPEATDESEVDSSVTSPDTAAEPSEPKRNYTGGIVMFTLAGVAGLGGIGAGIASSSIRADIESQCVDNVCPTSLNSDADTMSTLALVADIALSASLLSFVVGLVLAVTAPEREAPVAGAMRRCELLGDLAVLRSGQSDTHDRVPH